MSFSTPQNVFFTHRHNESVVTGLSVMILALRLNKYIVIMSLLIKEMT